MRILFFCIFSFYALAGATPAGKLSNDPSCNHTDTRFNCVQYIKNYDGDTITFNIPNVHPLFGKEINIRVFGIDSAEIKTRDKCEKSASLKAKELVTHILKHAKRIDLVDIQRDKYFRILANVIADGIDIKSKLISEKLAYSYDGGTKAKINWCDVKRVPAQQ